MTRRPLLAAAATLSAALTLTACNSSPEAGRPDTTPTASSTPTASPAVSPSPSSSFSAEETAAINAAKARYVTTRTAIDRALANPTKSSRAPLEAAGLGGSWLIAAIGDVRALRNDGWYQSGSVKVSSLSAESVDLNAEQPMVQLKACVDSSSTTLRFQKDDKPVPVGPASSPRRTFLAKVVFAPHVGKTAKMWFVVDEKAIGQC